MYIDGFILPIPSDSIEQYQKVAEQVGAIWKEYGAVAYYECVGDDFSLQGVKSFVDITHTQPDEVVIFGWAVFPSKEVRDKANAEVPKDPRMAKLVAPLTQGERVIFDASRMVYGGFHTLVEK
ncbi:MAG: DUF1428 domain-containing protein [Flavobacteriia bacterium]|nr:DUF1428 domain-containing protein [Flavobacteriia bacterium]